MSVSRIYGVFSPGSATRSAAWLPDPLGTLGPVDAVGTSADGAWRVVFGGALRNQRGLLDELRSRQIELRSGDPAEIIANILADTGVPRGLGRIEGDFVFAAFDHAGDRAFLVRDRTGSLPLYWARGADTPGAVHFDTDPAALARSLGLPRDPAMIPKFLALGYLPAPHSPYRGVHKLAVGSYVELRASAEQAHRWWPLTSSPQGFEGSRARWERTVEYAVELAVQQRVAVAGPVAVLHGGGVYSEALLGSVAERRRDAVMVLTAVPPEGGLLPGQSLARLQVSTQRVGRDPIEIRLPIDPLSTPDPLPEPLDRPELLLYAALADVARREEAGAILCGAGGAELFGVPGRRRDRWLPAALRTARRSAEDLDFSDLDRLEAEAPVEGRSLAPWVPKDPLATTLWVNRASVLPDAWIPALGALGIDAPLADGHVGAVVAQVPLGVLHGALPGGGEHGLFGRALKGRISADAAPSTPVLPVLTWLRPYLNGLPARLEGLVRPERVSAALSTLDQGDLQMAWRLAVLARWWGR